MTRGQAKKLGTALAGRGVIEFPEVGAKLPKGLRSTHGASSITGHWIESVQRPAPSRGATIACVDVAEAMAADGWSVAALRACSHTANAQRLIAA